MSASATARRAGDSFLAAIPEPFRILGLALRPFSLGRYRLLRRFDCAFVSDGDAKASMDDLLLGVLVCSMRCDDCLKFIDSPDRDSELKRWGKMIRKQIKREEDFDIYAKFNLFRQYLDVQHSIPKFWDETGDEESGGGSHWSHAIEVTLRSELGWSDEEICEQPITKALSDFFALKESRGLIRIMREDELESGAANAEAMARLAQQLGVSEGGPSGS